MGKIAFLFDRLSNLMSGMGTTVDKSVYAGYSMSIVPPAQVESSYRSSWLMRKIVDVPAIDMTRAWRSWQAESKDIEGLEAEEKKHKLKHKMNRALTLARLWGGAVVVIGVKNQGADPSQELKPESCGKDGLAYLTLFARHQISTGQLITDLESPWYGQPEYYLITPQGGTQVKIHPSRVVPFIGQPAPEGSQMQADPFWGDPLYQSIMTAIQNADLAQEGFASLIHEASLDVIKIPGLMDNIGSDEYERRLLERLQLAKTGESTWRAKILDADEEWDTREVTWAGIPDIITSYLQMVSGAADIPITRLLGTSPKGLQSTGDGEERDYHAMIEAKQDEYLAPALDRIDQFLIRSALGSVPTDIWYRFNPLARLSPKDASTIESQRATTIKAYSDTGLLPSDALAEIAKNAMNESGQWPGSEAAFEGAQDDPEGAAAGNETDPNAENDLLTEDERNARRPRRIMDAALTDARPRSLYVSRKLLNADELIRWAKAQGFETTQPGSAMHVTLAFSRKPVDWMQVGDDWNSDDQGRLRVKPGGPRTVEPLGDKGAVVLMFRNDALEWRHRRIHEDAVGAQWDFPEYQPHVTITWDAPADFDLSKVEPYTGPLVFGPEIFAEVVDDWEKTISEV